jgi:hypothetical protein
MDLDFIGEAVTAPPDDAVESQLKRRKKAIHVLNYDPALTPEEVDATDDDHHRVV